MDRKLRERAANLRSDRALERKRAAELLKDSLHYITRMDVNKSTFDFVFGEVHDFTLKEVEKFVSNTSKNPSVIILGLCDTLLNTTVSTANNFKLYIDAAKLFDCFFEITKNKRLCSILGKSYIKMMSRNVLLVSHYLQYVIPSQWDDLLEIGIKRLEIDSNFLTIVLREGIRRCHLTLRIRDNLTSLETLYSSDNSERKQHMEENLLEIAVITVENVAAESRLAICKFTETILPHVLKFYEKSSFTYQNQRKLLFKFIRLCIIIHHPKGIIHNESGSLANDWNSWNRCLISLYEIMIAEALFLNQNYEKNKNLNNKNVLLIDQDIINEYILFSVEICHQVFNGKVFLDNKDNEDLNCSKRIRLDYHDYITLSQTLDNLSKTLYPWISILKEYMKKYGHCISLDLRLKMLNVLFNSLKSEDSSAHSDLYECVVTVYEKIDKCDWNQDLNDLSCLIWNIALRKTSTQNITFDSCHKIIQHLLKRENFRPPLELLIKSYTDNNMPYSDSSIETLYIIFEQYSSKITSEKLRLRISQWVLENYISPKAIDTVTKLIFSLCLRENMPELQVVDERSNEDLIFKRIFNDIEEFLLISDFEVGLLNTARTNTNQGKNAKSILTLYNNVHKYVLKTLVENLSKNISNIKESKSFSPTIIMNLDVLLKFINYCAVYEISDYSSDFEKLKMKILESFTVINTFFRPFYELKVHSVDKKIELLKDLKRLYKNKNYNHDIANFVREKTYKEMIELFFNFKNKLEEDAEDENCGIMEGDQVPMIDYRLKQISIEIICNYCCYDTKYSKACLNNVLEPNFYEFDIKDDFNIACEMINFILRELQAEVPYYDVVIENAFQLMQNMCKICFRDEECAFKILKLLEKIMKPITRMDNENAKSNCVIMLKSFLSRCNNHYYSIKTMGQALKCLSWILNNPDLHDWSHTLDDIFMKTICSKIFSLRLYSCYCLHLYINNVAPEKYNELIQTLPEIFTVEDVSELTSFVVSDEGANRTSTVFHCLALVTLTSSVWDKNALAAIIKIGFKKNINIKLTKKILALIDNVINSNSSIMLTNTSFLISNWFREKLPIDQFPWMLTDCSSIQDFYYKYRHDLVTYESLFIESDSRNIIDLLLQTKRISRDELILECIPNITILCLSSVKYDEIEDSTSLKCLINKRLKIDTSNINDDTFYKKILSNIDIIIRGLISNVYDDVNIKEFFQWNGHLPYAFKPVMSLDDFESAMSFLKDSLPVDITQKIYKDDPTVLQKLLLEIWASTDTHYMIERKLLNLYHYWIFCKILNYETDLNTFICNFIVFSLLTLIDQYKNDAKFHHVSFAACKILYDILKNILPKMAKIISPLVSKIVKNISKYLCEVNICKREGLKILQLIFVNMESYSKEILFTLDPLPEIDIFIDFNRKIEQFSYQYDTLEKYIDTFLLGNLTNRSEGLKLLQKKLICHKEELKTLFGQLREIKSVKNSKLHKLTSALVIISSNKNDEESSLLATKCLGVIGSCNFYTLTLKVPSEDIHFLDSPEKCFTFTFFNEIRDLIFDPDPNVIRATTKALVSMMSYKNGKEILEPFDNSTMSELMLPFYNKKKMLPSANFQILSPMFKTYLDRIEIWYNSDCDNHEKWITNLMVSTLNSFSNTQSFLLDFIDICQLKPSLAEKCFPSLIGVILNIGNDDQVTTIINYIQKYFNRYYELTFKSEETDEIITQNSTLELFESAKSKNHSFPKASVKCMLQLIQFIRLQMKYYKWEDFQFYYLPISWAAYSTGSYFMSVLFGELWCNTLKDNVPPINAANIMSNDDSENMLSILRKSYEKIGDMDAILGCGSSHLSNLSARRKHFMASGHYMDAFLSYDLLLSSKRLPVDSNLINWNINDAAHIDTLASARSFAQCLHSSGLYHLSDKYMQSFGPDAGFDDIKFDCFWRLGDWNLQVDSSLLNCASSDVVNWSAQHYNCLKHALSRNVDMNDLTLSSSLKLARLSSVIDGDQYLNESCRFIYDSMEKLQCLQEIEDYVNTSSNCNNLISLWSITNMLPFENFKYVEPIFSQRICIYEHIIKRPIEIDTKLSVLGSIIKYIDFALQNDAVQTCYRWINSSRQMLNNIETRNFTEREKSTLQRLTAMLILSEGKVAWKSGQKDIALHLVKELSSAENHQSEIHSDSLLQLGSWMVETRSESAYEILNNYLLKSLNISGNDDITSSKINAYMTIAKFADYEYKQMDSYIKSPEFFNQIKCFEKSKDTTDSLKDKDFDNLTKEERKAMIINERRRQMDEVEIKNVKSEREHYLQLALNYYISSLCESDKNNFNVFRVISLWIDNSNLDSVYEKPLSNLFKMIPSWKFLILIPQLAPRLNSAKKDTFQNTLYELIHRCTVDHPHHVLPILMALKNSNKDSKNGDNKNRNKKSDADNEEGYVMATKSIIHALSISSKCNFRKCIDEMESLSTAMISLANYKVEKKTIVQNIPRSEPIKRLGSLPNILLPTASLPIDKTRNYNNVISIASFNMEFMLVGGINAPKKISCKGSDGKAYNMLLKGEDDIRQDAVIQQVFGIVNDLLANDKNTKDKRLIIRTYKVVPLSRKSGIIEWCDGTEPFGKLLIGPDGSSGYHAKLRPNDMPAMEARKLMNSIQKSSNDVKLEAFKSILAKFKPVFHNFFTLNFLTPAIWYEKRLAYMNSVATSSMTGYILGLGDRHVQNILIDMSTAEVIHIDFGIAFEYGRLQPTPETVPFRLTQDMVAGFGCTGLEGVFKKSCERIMDVLKTNQETLLTILEVLLFDPLYIWTISKDASGKTENSLSCSLSSMASSSTSNNSSGKSGSEAKRALIRVKNKLNGIEFGSTLATSGQVVRLIQQAMDAKNLSRLFPGWQPYL